MEISKIKNKFSLILTISRKHDIDLVVIINKIILDIQLIFQDKIADESAAKTLIGILLKKTKKKFNIFTRNVPENVYSQFLSEQGILFLLLNLRITYSIDLPGP